MKRQPAGRAGTGSRKPREKLAALQTAALEAAADAIVITDRRGTILWVNPALLQLTGYSRKELIGQNPRILKSGQQPPSFYETLWKAILSGEKWQGTIVNRRKDGSLYDEEMIIAPVRSRGGRITHFIAIKRDVTDRTRAEARIGLLAQAVENSSELIGVGDSQGYITYVNQAFLKALGYSREELIGKHTRTVLSTNNPPALIEEILTKGFESCGWRGECLVPTRDGFDLPVFLSTSQIKDEEGHSLGTLGIAQIISDRKRAEEALRQSAEQFRELTEHIREVFFVRTPGPEARTLYVSPAYEEVWGRPRQEVYERLTAWSESIHPEDHEQVLRVYTQPPKDMVTNMVYRIVRPDGSLRWIRDRSWPVSDPAGKPYRVVGIAEDITERKRGEEALRESNENLNRALKESEGVAQESAKLTELVDMIDCCETVEQAYDITRGALESLFAPHAGALFITNASRDAVEAVACWGISPGTAEVFNPGDCWALRRGKIHKVEKGKSPLWCPHVSGSPVGGYVCVPLAAQGETLGLLYVEAGDEPSETVQEPPADTVETLARQATAVSERLSLALANLRLREILRKQSVRDPLTGLFNQRFMQETLARELSQAARKQTSLALAIFDVDHFKEFNDRFGHDAGDLVLRKVAGVVQSRVRSSDVPCRFGGDEFVVILPETVADVARDRMESIRSEIESFGIPYRDQALPNVTVSIGIAVFPQHGTTADELVHAADQALYRAKREGRDRVIVG
jgi:diguanylate cyclase (GGDEF)-like protein/PAS domain S-box-containing protein